MQDTGGFSLGLQSAGLQDTLVPRKNTGDAEKKTEDESSPWIINEPDACDSVSYWMSISELLYIIYSICYCYFKGPEMLLGVAAAVYAFERREIIRQTWGTYAQSENVKVITSTM